MGAMIRRATRAGALLAVCASLIGAVPAEAATPSPPKPAAPTETAPATFAPQLQAYYAQVAAIGHGNPVLEQRFALVERANAGQEALAELNPQQLASLYKVMATIPGWQQMPAKLKQAMGRQAAAHAQLLRVKTAQTFRREATGDNCPAGAPGGIDGVIKAKAAAQAGQDAATLADAGVIATDTAVEIVPDSEVFGVIAVAVGEGGGTVATLPVSPERVVAEVFNAVAKAVKFTLEATADVLETIAFSLESVQAVSDACFESAHIAALDSLTAQVASDVATINSEIAHAQTTLDTKIEQRQVHLKAISVSSSSFLISTDESGVPVDTTLVSLKTADQNATPIRFGDVTGTATTTKLTPGVLQVSLPSSQPSTTVFQIEVKDDGSSGVVHYGTLLFTC